MIVKNGIEWNKNPICKMIAAKDDGFMYKCVNGLCVIQSIEIIDGKKWVHTSFSRKNRVPDYKDMKYIKETFIGDGKKAIMIFPEKKYHVNIHSYCLHFFTCIDNDGLPDFTHGTGSL